MCEWVCVPVYTCAMRVCDCILDLSDVPPTSDAAEKKAESSAPDTEEKSDIQLEPTQEEMERERLTSKAEQVK